MRSQAERCGDATSNYFVLYYEILRRQCDRPRVYRTTMLARALFVLGYVTFVCIALCARTWHGLSNFGCADAGYHLQYYNQFKSGDLGVYNGFIGFYALLYLIERASGLDVFHVFSLAFYVVVFGFCVVAVTLAGLDFRVTWRWIFFAVLSILFFIPLLFYQQGEGFFTHLAGLVTFLSAVACYATTPNSLVRMGVLIGFAGLQRFVYGLNLADYLLAGALVLALESSADDATFARAKRIVALILGIAGAYAYLKLEPLFPTQGHIRPVRLFLTGLAGAAACVLFVGGAFRTPEPALRRLLLLAGFFVGCSSLANVGFLISGGGASYYNHKYPLFAAMLTLLLVVRLSFGAVPRWEKPWIPKALACLATFGFLYSYSDYYSPYFRARGNRPLIELSELSTIEQVLTKNGESLSAYFGPSWPQTKFMNEAFGREFRYEEFLSPKLRNAGCVFWISDKQRQSRTQMDLSKRAPHYLEILRSLSELDHVQRIELSGERRPIELSYRCGAS